MLDNEKIAARDFAFSVTCIIQSSVLLTSFFIYMTRQDSYLVILFGALAVIPLILIYCFIMKYYPDKNLFQVLEAVFGRGIGKIFSLFYLYFFFQLTTLNLHDLGTFVNSSLMPNTPLIVIVLIIVCVAAYAVNGGIIVATKYAAALTVVVLLVFILAILLTLEIIDISHFAPTFEYPFSKYLQSTQAVTTIPFGEVVIFLMVTPNIKIKPKKIKKFFFTGFFIGAFTLFIVVASSISLLGESIYLYTIPPFEMFTLINITSALSRMEILAAIVMLILLFFKISVLYYVLVIAVGYFFNLSEYKFLTHAIGLICVVYSMFIYDSMVNHMFLARNVTIFIWPVFELVFPLAIVIGTLIKKKIQEASRNNNANQNNQQPQENNDSNTGEEVMTEVTNVVKEEISQDNKTPQTN